MAPHNSYLVYKRDTKHLLYWMAHASNSIIKTLPIDSEGESLSRPALNTTGQTTVAGLLAMAELIGNHINPVPSAILQLLQSVISARSAHYAEFQQFAEAKPSPEIERSNASHKYFIDALTTAFKALGGDAWVSREEAGHDSDEIDIEDTILNNKFSALKVDTDEGDGSSDEASDNATALSTVPQRRTKRKPGKGKKGKKGSKTKAKKKQKDTPAKLQNLEEVPLESYRIIQDEDGIMTEYLMAAYSIAKEWGDLRNYLQTIWHDVAYQGFNSAVAGTLSNLAIGMVKKSETAIFLDFPGHDSYETLMQTITRGNIEKVANNFTVALHVEGPTGVPEKLQETSIDVKEHVLINAYDDLIAFITDYQKTRSGKPTKAMLAEIGNWDPRFNVQRATREQRLKWRRSYTINWLYDLVNVFSSVVIQRIRVKGERHVLENVDWSTHGPWRQHRMIFGINEFASFVTTLAMQKPGTDIRQKILPHHVFHLQCIVDAFTVSRGWSFNLLRGHVLEQPAREFRPRRDVDEFLDRNNNKEFGYLQAVDILKQLLEEDACLNGEPTRHNALWGVLEAIQFDFINWLGESKYMYGLNMIPPSRFSNSDANGLWEYSPFLCGVGLMEGLELSYRAAMFLWEALPEPTMLIHLHNMLVQKGYIAEPVGLYASLQEVLSRGFFVDSEAPTSNFHTALSDRIRNAKFSSRSTRFDAPASAHREPGVHSMLDVQANDNFKKKSNLLLYRDAGWDLDRIPDFDLDPFSVLGLIRISQTKRVTDPATGIKRLQNTDLVRRLRDRGVSEEEIILMTNQLVAMKQADHGQLAKAQAATKAQFEKDGYNIFSNESFRRRNGKVQDTGIHLTGSDILGCVKADIHNDVCGDVPISGVNYISITMRFFMQFMQFEQQLTLLRNPLYVRVYEKERQWSRAKRMGLVTLALIEQDEECLQVMAEEFQHPRCGFMNFVYWDKLVPVSEMLKKRSKLSEDPTNVGCSVM
ncbi:uncharacterized protein CTRU02_203315 [Colletotrichum truncatum]|uniref:Uncharacterized protein n=1 Tax=Colletotrichum truncatum TaxID=5467 RepID=A0ACC3Z917_COLTU|nr:uncharacterized protein CTRU02_15669 [Colletotrichum truncatum]KAF6780795.1 hypothetical protein CTRU02_15669 [Colletotrichum truncatum]